MWLREKQHKYLRQLTYLVVSSTNLIDLASSSLQRFSWPGTRSSFKHDEANCYFFSFFFLYMSVQTPTSTSISRVEFLRVIYRAAKSYFRRAAKVTSTVNSDKAGQKWFSFPGIIARDIRLYFKYIFSHLFSHQALPHSQKVHIIAT